MYLPKDMSRDKLIILQQQISELEQYLPIMASENPEVSKANIAWHISHSLKVIEQVTDALLKSDPRLFRKTFNLKRFLVLTFGKIPRGKAKAPRVVLPDQDLSREILLNQISEVNKKIPALSILPKKAFFKHPFFKHIDRAQTKKFLVIHTEHHLKIIRDILGNNFKASSGK